MNNFFIKSDVNEPMLADSFYGILQEHSVWVPRQAFEAWILYLQDLNDGRAAPGPAQKRQLIETLFNPLGKALLTYARFNPLTNWARAASVITIEVLTQALDVNWPEEFWKQFCAEAPENVGRISPILLILNQLYSSEAQSPLGGPLHFFYLAQACKLIPAVIDRAARSKLGTYQLDEYLNVLELTLNPRRRVRTYHLIGLPNEREEDWCFRYLAQTISRRTEKQISIEPAAFVQEDSSWDSNWASWMRSIFRGKPRNHNVAIVGMKGSGRSTMLEVLQKASFNSVELGPPMDVVEKGGQKFLTLPGNKQGLLDVVDVAALEGKQSPNGDRSALDILKEAVNIILVVPAFAFECADGKSQEELQSEVGKHLVESLARAIHELHLGTSSGPYYNIAIAYTMIDEFGCCIPEQMRIIETATDWQAFLDFARIIQDPMHNNHDSAWQTFVYSLADAKSSEADIVKLRRIVLNGTRTLWQAIARDFDKRRAVLNGYLVQSRPVLDTDPDVRNWRAAGCLQIFSDIIFEENRPRR